MAIKRPVIQRITAWSFSRWSLHSGENGCPLRAKLEIIDKRRGPTPPAMARGADIHKLAEAALAPATSKKKAVPAELKTVAKAIAQLRLLKAQAELELCLTRDWAKTGWFDANAWLRIKIDAIAWHKKRGAKVVDWKTGKYKPDNKEYDLQLELYGAGVLSAYGDVDEVETSLVFTDHDQRAAPPIVRTYARDDVPRLVKAWETRVKPLLSDTRFSPRPGWYCRNCHHRKSNGGTCQF